MKRKQLQQNSSSPAVLTSEIQSEKFFVRGVPGTIDEEARTVDVTFTTGSRGLRMGWLTDYYEELEVSKKALDLDRLNKGAAVLYGHDSYSVDSHIGVVERAVIEDGEGVATVRFGKDEASDKVFQKVKDGILRNVSVGYMVHEYVELDETENDLPIFRATKWEPMEVSFVSVPFDAGAQVRSLKQNSEKNKCLINIREGSKMHKILKTRSAEVSTAAVEAAGEVSEVVSSPANEVEKVPNEGVASQQPAVDYRAGVSSIMKSAETAKLSLEDVRGIVTDFQDGKIKIEQAHERVVAEWSKRNQKVQGSMGIEIGNDKMDTMARGIQNAIEHRLNPKVALDESGRHYRGLSLLEISREYLAAVGINTRGMTRHEVAAKLLSRDTRLMVRTGFQGVTDFPNLLANVGNKTLQAAYARAEQTFKSWTRQASAPDFKAKTVAQLGEGPALVKKAPHGEYKYGKFGEKGETYALATYGVIVALTREAIINDDLSAFDRIIQALGFNAADLESDIVYAILTANAALADGVALFHATHKNLGTAGPVGATTLSEMRKLGRKQTGIDGKLLNIAYETIIVPAAQETVAQQAVSAVVPNQTTGVNPFTGLYKVVAEPRLDATSETVWYAAATPGRVDTIEYCYLEGNESVFIDQEIEFDTDGIKYKARHDFAAKAIDHRGLFKNPYAG